MKHFWKAILWILIILYLSLSPSDTFPEVGIVNFDKLVHLFIYFIQTFLFLIAFHKSNPDSISLKYIFSAIIGIILGAGIEVLQGTELIKRHADWLDLLANCMGVIIALLLYNFISFRLKNYKLWKFL